MQGKKSETDSPVAAPSLKRRFAYKILGNFAALALGVVALAVVPRALGPADYGRFEFLSANFKLILDTLTLQLPVAYFNWISRKGHIENTDYASGVTLYFSVAAVVLCALLIFATVGLDLNGWIWPDVPPVYLWLSLLLTALIFAFQLLSYLADGRALTVGLEKIRLVQNLVKTAGILALFYFGVLTLRGYFAVQIALMAGVVGITVAWLIARGACSSRALRPWAGTEEEAEKFRRHAISFSRPLMVSMLVGFAVMYFDRWFLQMIGGAAQQGYFSLSDRMGILAILFTSAMTPLLSREFAHAHEQGNHERLITLFEHIKKFFFIAAAIGCFMSVQSDRIVDIVGGTVFSGAVLPLAIMALAPIHQTLGQLSGALLIATHQTRLYAKISIASMMISPLVAYLLLAPANWEVPGWELGATGLAIKTLLLYLVGTNVQLYFNTKFLGVPYRRWMLYQIEIIGLVYLVALLSWHIAALIPIGHISLWGGVHYGGVLGRNILALGFSSAVYIILLGLLVWGRPALAGMSNGDLGKLLRGRF